MAMQPNMVIICTLILALLPWVLALPMGDNPAAFPVFQREIKHGYKCVERGRPFNMCVWWQAIGGPGTEIKVKRSPTHSIASICHLFVPHTLGHALCGTRRTPQTVSSPPAASNNIKRSPTHFFGGMCHSIMPNRLNRIICPRPDKLETVPEPPAASNDAQSTEKRAPCPPYNIHSIGDLWPHCDYDEPPAATMSGSDDFAVEKRHHGRKGRHDSEDDELSLSHAEWFRRCKHTFPKFWGIERFMCGTHASPDPEPTSA